MELIDNLLNDKKTVIIMAIAYVIVMVVALVIIWGGDEELEISKYTPYDEEQINKKMALIHFSDIADIAVYDSVEYIEKLISPAYLNYTEKTAQDVLEQMKFTGTYPTVGEVNVISAGDKLIYRAYMDFGKDNKYYINAIETSPYNMYFTFDTFYDYKQINKYSSASGVKCTVQDVYQDLNYVEYNIEVLNNSDSNVSIDFASVNDIYILLDDNTKVSIQNAYNTPTFENMAPNNVGARKLMFLIDVTKQNNIESLNIDNVVINGEEKSISINL